ASASTSTFSVADAALTAGSLTPPTATEGAAFSNVPVFHFTDEIARASGRENVSTAVAGDATLTRSANPSNVQIVANGGGFDVRLSYTYAEEMTGATFSVSVPDHAATASASTSTFSVADAALTAGSLTPPTATEGAAFSNVTVFHFTD